MQTLEQRLIEDEGGERPRRRGRWINRARRRLIAGWVFGEMVGAAVAVAYCLLVLGVNSPAATTTVLIAGALAGFLLAYTGRSALDFFKGRYFGLRRARCDAMRRDAVRKALDRLQEASAADPGNAQVLNDLAVAYWLEGDYEQASAALRQAAELEPNRPEYHNNLGVVLGHQEERERALAELRRAMELQPALPGAEANVGILAFDESADGSAEDLGELKPSSPLLLHNLGVYRLRHGDAEQAVSYLDAALAANPAYALARAHRALARPEAKAADRVAELRAAVRADRTDPRLRTHLGVALYEAGQTHEAAGELLQALSLDSRYVPAHLNLALVWSALGLHDEALLNASEAQRLEPGNVRALCLRGWLLMAVDELEDAEGDFAAALSVQEDCAEALTNRGVIAWRRGEASAADEWLERALQVAPNQPAAVLNAALAHIASGRASEAGRMLTRISARASEMRPLSFALGLAQFQAALGEFGPAQSPRDAHGLYAALYRASREFETCVQHDTLVAEASNNLGVYWAVRKEYDEAISWFERAQQADPRLALVSYCIGTCQALAAGETIRAASEERAEAGIPGEARQRLVAARAALQRSAEEVPGHVPTLSNLGLAHYMLGDHDAAASAFRKAATLEKSANSYNNLALALAKKAEQGERGMRVRVLVSDAKRAETARDVRSLLSSAISCFMQALQLERGDPLLHSNIGLAYFLRNQDDDVTRAMNHWELMRRIGGERGRRQFERMMGLLKEQQRARAEFIDSQMSHHPIDPDEVLLTIAPRPVAPRPILEYGYDRTTPQMLTEDPDCLEALSAMSKTAEVEKRVARLRL